MSKAADEMVNITKFWNPIPDNVKKYGRLFLTAEKLYRILDENKIYTELAQDLK
jgi:hypothetical protein